VERTLHVEWDPVTGTFKGLPACWADLLPEGTVQSEVNFEAMGKRGSAEGEGVLGGADRGKILPVKPTRRIRKSVVGNLTTAELAKLEEGKKKNGNFLKRMSIICTEGLQNLKKDAKELAGKQGKRMEEGAVIGTPYNVQHKEHVEPDPNEETGFRGLPAKWSALLKASGITKEDAVENPQAVRRRAGSSEAGGRERSGRARERSGRARERSERKVVATEAAAPTT
jgi:hypothetical protein